MECWVEKILEIFMSIPIIPSFQHSNVPMEILGDSCYFYRWKIG